MVKKITDNDFLMKKGSDFNIYNDSTEEENLTSLNGGLANTKKQNKGPTEFGRKKIEIQFIEDKSRRSVTFSKRKKGIMKKCYELTVLTGCEILLLIANENGHVYTFATQKLRPVIITHENFIQHCLNGGESEFNNAYYDENNFYDPYSE